MSRKQLDVSTNDKLQKLDSKKFDETQTQLLRANSNISAGTEDVRSIQRPMPGMAGMLTGIQNTVLAMVKEAKDKAKKDMWPLCSSRIVLGKYGPGYPLYFEYIFFCGIILALMFVIVSIHSLYNNHAGNTCKLHKSDKEFPCRGGTAVIYSIGNRGETDSFRISSVLNLTFTLIALVLAFFYRKIQAKTANQVDDNAVTAADYTVMVQNLPPTERAEDVKKFFQEHKKDGKLVNVVRVSMAYQIGGYVDLIRKRHILLKSLAKSTLSSRQNHKLGRIETEIKAFKDNLPGGPSIAFTGIAFVTFNTQKETTEVINKFAMGSVQGALYSIFSGFAGCFGKESEKLYKGRIIHVQRSHEPNDIYWENLGLPAKLVMKRKAINLICSFLLIICCFGMILGINYAQAYASIHAKIKAIITVLSILSSVFIVVINASLGTFVRKLARYEKPETNTSYQVNVAEGLSMAQFINTAFVTLLVEIVQAGKLRLWISDGIVPGFFFVFILNAFVPSATKFFNVGYFLKSMKRKKALEGKHVIKDQKEADKLFEDPPFDTAQFYAVIQKTMMFTAFYASMIPLGVLFTMLGLFVTYWVDKYVFMRRTNRPPILGKALAEEMADYLEVIIVCFCAGNVLFQKVAADSISLLNLVALGISGLVMILPNGTLLSCCFPDKEDNEDSQYFYANAAVAENFNGYEEVNPVVLQEEKNPMVVNDMDGRGNVKESGTPQGNFNNGVDLDALETYALHHLTFLQAQKLKEKGHKIPITPTAKGLSKPALEENKIINNATFNMAAMIAVEHQNLQQEKSGGGFGKMFRGLFRREQKSNPKNMVVKVDDGHSQKPSQEALVLQEATPLPGYSPQSKSPGLQSQGTQQLQPQQPLGTNSSSNTLNHSNSNVKGSPQRIESQQMRVRANMKN